MFTMRVIADAIFAMLALALCRYARVQQRCAIVPPKFLII